MTTALRFVEGMKELLAGGHVRMHYLVVLDDDRRLDPIIGSISESPDPPAPPWVWAIWGSSPPPPKYTEPRCGDLIDPPPGWEPAVPPITGREASLVEAQAAFRGAWEAIGPIGRLTRSSLRLKPGDADQI